MKNRASRIEPACKGAGRWYARALAIYLGRRSRRLLLCGLFLGYFSLAQNSGSLNLIGVGSTVPLSAFLRLLPEFEKTHKNLQVRYLPFGSERGKQMVASGTGDFAASEAPVFTGHDIQISYFPVLIGAIVPIYNLHGVIEPLSFTPKALAGIYLGKIKRWDDPALTSVNPGAALPASDIVVIHSAAGRGSSYIWSDYLSKVSLEWRTSVGRKTSPKWPIGMAAEGSGNVAKTVQQTPNSIGYVELVYASQSGLPAGKVQNAAGKFVTADQQSILAAADGVVKNTPADFRCSLTNPPGEASYPIASFSWIMIATSSAAPKQQAVKDLLRWMLGDGQTYLASAGFAPVPQEVVDKELRALDNLP